MRARRLGVLVGLVVLAAGCSPNASPSPPASAAGAPGPSSQATAAPPGTSTTPTVSERPSPTLDPSSLAALIADPLPSVDASDLEAIAPGFWKAAAAVKGWKYTDRDPDPPGEDEIQDDSGARWVCATEPAGVSAKQAALEREAACTAAIAHAWKSYAFEWARTTYAYAATALGPDARARIDAALAALPAPAASGDLRPGKDLVAEKGGSPSVGALYEAFHDAVMADPTGSWWWASMQSVGKPRVDRFPTGAAVIRTLDACAHFPGSQPKTASDLDADFSFASGSLQTQLIACDGLIQMAWNSYRRTGTDVAYHAAAIAYRFGEARLVVGCAGALCKGNYDAFVRAPRP